MMTRRQAIKTTALATAAVAIAPAVIGQNNPVVATTSAFTLPPLPYALDALEPNIDARTMEIHHGKHHKAYVDNLNKAVAAHPEILRTMSIEQMLHDIGGGGVGIGFGISKQMSELPVNIRATIRNNGGGHFNHALFWQMMKKDGGGEPKAELGKVIESSFGNFADFKTKFTEAATKTFGSGWAWLVLSKGKLAILALPNQDSPLSGGEQPLLGLDVWEHAYYLKYQNKRADYIAAWWNVVNWDFVAERYAKLKGQTRISRINTDGQLWFQSVDLSERAHLDFQWGLPSWFDLPGVSVTVDTNGVFRYVDTTSAQERYCRSVYP